MTAYERTKAAGYGILLGRELESVNRAAHNLFKTPGELEVEEAIRERARELVRALRRAMNAAQSLHYEMQRDDERPVKNLNRT
jgi:hypothetical protein